jgi:hypothetical protein
MASRNLTRSSAWLVLLALACALVDLSRYNPAGAPAPLPTATRTRAATHPPGPAAVTATGTRAPIPNWVRGFAEPILESLAGRPPDFRDDFSEFRGWYHPSAGGAYRAEISDDVLHLQLPDGAERRVTQVFNARLVRADFVLMFDFKFGKSEPGDSLRFQLDESAARSLRLDLAKNEDWTIAWRLLSQLSSQADTYDYFAPEWISVTIVVRGEQCAVLLNRDPLVHAGSCRSGSAVRPSPQAVSFQLLSVSGRPAELTIDNVMQWDLTTSP